MKIALSTSFKKDYKRLINNEKIISAIDDAILLLAKGESLPAKYKEHPLHGNWNGYNDCHIFPDIVLIFKRDLENGILKLARIGSHNQVFG
jgi:mRNA interferase YafQ